MDLAHEAPATLEVAAELVDKLIEARTSLSAGDGLMRFWNWGRYRQRVANEQRDGFDQDGLVALQAIELMRQPIEPRDDRGVAPVGAVRRQVGR